MAAILKYLLHDLYIWAWAGCFAYLMMARRRSSRSVRRIIAGAVLTWIIATRPVAELALVPHERAFSVPTLTGLCNSGIQDVVVLSGGGGDNRYTPLASQALNEATLCRLMAGLELCSLLDGDAQLIVTGAGGDNTADEMARLAKTLQPDLSVSVDSTARRTLIHPAGVKPFLRSERLILVTSASHVPRAVSTFKRAGLDPLPYPAHFRYATAYRIEDFIPSVNHLRNLEVAFYEYLGRAQYAFYRH